MGDAPSLWETFHLILLLPFPHVEGSWEMGIISKADKLGVAIHTKSQACGMEDLELGAWVQLCGISTQICSGVGLGGVVVLLKHLF